MKRGPSPVGWDPGQRVQSLAPVFKIRLTDQTTAGSQIPQSRALGRPGRGVEGDLETQLAVVAEFSPRYRHCSQLQFTQETGRSIQPW